MNSYVNPMSGIDRCLFRDTL